MSDLKPIDNSCAVEDCYSEGTLHRVGSRAVSLCHGHATMVHNIPEVVKADETRRMAKAKLDTMSNDPNVEGPCWALFNAEAILFDAIMAAIEIIDGED